MLLLSAENTIREVVGEVRATYAQSYGLLEPQVPNIAAWAVSMALENIRRSDAPYHDVEHTAMVVLVGLEIARGRHLRRGGISPHDWLQYVVALACHDIGYVRGVLEGDAPGRYRVGADTYVDVDDDWTDAALTPWHVERGKLFVWQRFADRPHLHPDVIAANIEHTRFPVPESDDYRGTESFPALVRAADLIGQLADPRYLQKLPRLFAEFQETGTAKVLGFDSPGDVRRGYPAFFWNCVRPFVGPALEDLRATSRGQQWAANLHSKVFEVLQELEG